ncbi:MAG: M48 family metallopeptidase [Alphaproteobacteria bacterium]|jgi:predicted Zn-dependent protease|nr:M48 family metallopeptidase [Alphaproteobacteria bacterium]MBT4019710.1 M48 family metallopeptidase [Alphaproteobacteria bacterium]MBT5160726.1 M48 family metallopeptidase [Alphaproteobacteria bacterium]MBT5918082.1 M48 family metallopeptidase [Alphaproteobacteria bacterium]MBT6386178.1 M48 family metallopeptidase [Alphaproteobacteria bacterium]
MVLILVSVFALPTLSAVARVSLIRDAEIEHSIRAFATPLFAAAGLDAKAVSVHIVNDRTLNAFVAGGQRIFINTGLILAVDSASEILGVLAHESGHIIGGHLIRTREAMESANTQSIIAMILGMAAIVGSKGDVGSAVISGGGHVAQRSLLRYSRIQESIADQSAIRIMAKANYAPDGMLAMLQKLRGQETLITSRQDPYVRSHPLTSDRITTMREAVAKAGPGQDISHFETMLARMKAKIYAYMEDPVRTFRRYPESDRSVAGRYGRAIALHREARTDEALGVLTDLEKELPRDPYIQELKGQFLFENGKARQAVPVLIEAAKLSPDDFLILTLLGQAEIASEEPAMIHNAIAHLKAAARLEPRLASIWRHLAIAYGRSGEISRSSLASAEFSLLTGRPEEARHFAAKALAGLLRGSPDHLRAEDIQRSAIDMIKRRLKKKNR